MAQLTKTQIRRLDDMVATRMAKLDTTNGDELIAYAELTEIRETFEAMLTEGITEQVEKDLAAEQQA